jgi:hypothetical protein
MALLALRAQMVPPEQMVMTVPLGPSEPPEILALPEQMAEMESQYIHISLCLRRQRKLALFSMQLLTNFILEYYALWVLRK